MSPLKDGLERILSHLEENELEIARFESLQPGLTFEKIDSITATLPFRLPLEVYQLYQWGNGAWKDEEWYGKYFLGNVFLPLESAVEIYQTITNTLEPRIHQLPDKTTQIKQDSVRTNWPQGWMDFLISRRLLEIHGSRK